MKVLDLFSGIGGFSLGLERAGMKTVAFCEIESFPRMVAIDPRMGGHKGAEYLLEAGIDVICGGFPCQDISCAGKGAGLSGERSGLWRELLRTIRLVRPLYVLVENVAALLHRGMGTVLGDLAKSGYDTEWGCISANDVGAPHLRERIWIIGTNTHQEQFDTKPEIKKCGSEIADNQGIHEGMVGSKGENALPHADRLRQSGQGQYIIPMCTEEIRKGKADHLPSPDQSMG